MVFMPIDFSPMGLHPARDGRESKGAYRINLFIKTPSFYKPHGHPTLNPTPYFGKMSFSHPKTFLSCGDFFFIQYYTYIADRESDRDVCIVFDDFSGHP